MSSNNSYRNQPKMELVNEAASVADRLASSLRQHADVEMVPELQSLMCAPSFIFIEEHFPAVSYKEPVRRVNPILNSDTSMRTVA